MIDKVIHWFAGCEHHSSGSLFCQLIIFVWTSQND